MKQEKMVEMPWNSDTPAIAGMTCGQAAVFLTGAISAYRAMATAGAVDGDIGVAKMAVKILTQAIDVCSGDAATTKMKESNLARLSLTIMAVGQGIMISTSNANISPMEVAGLVNSSLGVLNNVIAQEKEKFASSFVEFGVRFHKGDTKKKSQIEVGAAVIPNSDVIAQASAQDKSVLLPKEDQVIVKA